MKSIELTKDFFDKPEIERKIILLAIRAYLNGEPSNPPVTGMKKRSIDEFLRDKQNEHE
jgi:hypothetical protein